MCGGIPAETLVELPPGTAPLLFLGWQRNQDCLRKAHAGYLKRPQFWPHPSHPDAGSLVRYRKLEERADGAQEVTSAVNLLCARYRSYDLALRVHIEASETLIGKRSASL